MLIIIYKNIRSPIIESGYFYYFFFCFDFMVM